MKCSTILTLVLLLVAGCSRTGEKPPVLLTSTEADSADNATDGGTSTAPRGPALSESSRRELLTINSIKVAPIELSDDAKRAASVARFDEIVRQEVDSGLDIQVVDAKGDGVLSLELTTLQERVGGKIGAEEPAAIGFEMKLVRATDGKVIWNSQYSKREEPLSKNLLKLPEKFGRGGTPTWRSADELFRAGVKDAVRDLQARRMAAFVR